MSWFIYLNELSFVRKSVDWGEEDISNNYAGTNNLEVCIFCRCRHPATLDEFDKSRQRHFNPKIIVIFVYKQVTETKSKVYIKVTETISKRYNKSNLNELKIFGKNV